MPTAFVAPAGPKPRHDDVPAARFHAEGYRVAIGATVAVGQDKKENDRRRDEAEHEEPDENDGEYDRVRHRTPLEPLFHLKPRLYIREIAFDPFYNDFRTFRNRCLV